MSIWTHALRKLEYHPHWSFPGGNGTENVIITGSGNNWGTLYKKAHEHNCVLVGGGDPTVGLGGYLQGGGHGPLSSQFGLGADQVLQVTVVTTDGRQLVANNAQNQDLFWAIKGGGAGQYGIVTEYVLKTHHTFSSVVTGSLNIYGSRNASADATWTAVATLLNKIPDIMDSMPIAGTVNIAKGSTGGSMVGANYTVPGAVITPSFYGYNMTQAQMRRVLQELAAQAVASSDARSIIAKPGNFQEYPSFFDYFNSTTSSSSESVADSLMSSRLLGRAELSELPTSDLKQHLQRLLEHSPFILLGLQGGRGPRNVPTELGGAVNPIWRRIYAHALSFGTPINTTGVPSVELKKAGQWAEVHPEAVWREWAPDTGAYMNEANCFNSHWKHDFYGVYYDELLDVKRKYDPTGSLYVISGVGSDEWEYDLHSGLLCRVD